MSSSLTTDAKTELINCEKEISHIKALLRSLGPGSEDEPNQLTMTWTKTEGLPEAAEPKLVLQLSSPIEEATMTKADDADAGQYTFRGVETGQATLTVTASDNDIPLGVSSSHDLAPLLKFDAVEQESLETELVVAIHPEGKEESDDAAEPVCSVTFKMTFLPSKKDRREELYESLNKITQKKAAAVEKLRQAAMSAHRQQQGAAAGGTMTTGNARAVKAGFLNKEKPQSKWVQKYNRYLGPDSMVRRLFPVVKNYVFFIGVTVLMHFKGQLLALPPPV